MDPEGSSKKGFGPGFLGLDPGSSSGSIAFIGSAILTLELKSSTEKDVVDFLVKVKPSVQFAMLELVHSFPGQGVASSFNFGASYGSLRMALVATGISFETVTPTKWQKIFGLPTLKDAGSKTIKKNAHKARAQELFPDVRITHAIADAILIAEYNRRTRGTK